MDSFEMEEPFRKRPRLSMFPSEDQLDDDLGGRRTRNDLLLKSRFESIFEKYSHDFSGVGDEIEMDTLTVVVNNGHLQSMENETDPGGLHNAKGQSLLRAMTEALGDEEEEDYNAGADEVMNSIEEMAESAAFAEDQEETSPLNSDEELFLPVHARSSFLTPPDSQESRNTMKSEPVDSERNSLFEGHQGKRSESPDSLFEVQQRPSLDFESSDQLFGFSSQDVEVDNSAILQKFGPQVGQEVLAVIERAKNAAAQAHIEPAWRIPTSVVHPGQRQVTSKSKTPSDQISMHSDVQQFPSPEHATSLWKPARFRSTKRATYQARVMRRIRAESEDPLQEDFTGGDDKTQPEFDDGDASDWEVEQRPYERKTKPKKQKSDKKQKYRQSDEDTSDWEEEAQPTRKKKQKADEEILQMRKGTCCYCQRQWANRSGVFKHWNKLASLFEQGKIDDDDDDDIHDLDYIYAYVSSSNRIPRGPKLIVSDFKTLVELYEGAGISFDEIAELQVLRTKKTGIALNDVYDRYRTLSDSRNVSPVNWSEDDLQLLLELCENPRREMGSLCLHFEDHSNTDVGEKLAEIWLGDLIDSGKVVSKAGQQAREKSPEADHPEVQEIRESSLEELFVKQEPDSDDELFLSR
jgi:hypothetical protein